MAFAEGVDDAALAAQASRFDLIVVAPDWGEAQRLVLEGRVQQVDPAQDVVSLPNGLANGEAVRNWVERALEHVALHRERARLLDENLEFARFQSIHQRSLDYFANPDLEWLQERVLADMAGLCNAQSGTFYVTDDSNALRLKAYRGLLDKRLLPDPLDTKGLLTSRLTEGAPWISGEGRARALMVPLSYGGELFGLAQLADPLAGEFRVEDLRSAKALADASAVALRTARRFLALQRLGLRDRETAAYNLSYFTDYAAKEIYKARRYGRVFSLLTFSIDNLPQLRLRLGPAEARRATRGVIRALSRLVRDADVLAKASDSELYLLLPETDFFGALMFGRRAVAAAREEPDVQQVEARLPLSLVSSAATFPQDGEDFDDLTHRCRQRMDAARLSLHRKLHLDGLSFWEEVELLLGLPGSPRLPVDDRGEPARRGKVSSSLFEELQVELARDLMRDPSARGLIYLAVPEVYRELPLVRGLDVAPPEFTPRVYVLGKRADLETHAVAMPVFVHGDERMNRCEILLWLTEHAAYALLQRRGKGTAWAFHTSDATVVDGLIAKLQAEYDLQPY